MTITEQAAKARAESIKNNAIMQAQRLLQVREDLMTRVALIDEALKDLDELKFDKANRISNQSSY